MTRDEIRSLIAYGLGSRTDLNDQIDLHIRLAQSELEKSPELPWFLQVKSGCIQTVTGVEYISTPPGFLREVEEADWQMCDVNGDFVRFLKKKDIGELEKCYGVETSGSPMGYAVIAHLLYFRPIPDGVYNVNTFYYQADTALTSNISNQWSDHSPMSLVGEAGKLMAMHVQNDRALQSFSSMAQEAAERLRISTIARDMANREDYMGGR